MSGRPSNVPADRSYTITHGAAGVGLVLDEEQFDRLLSASADGWDSVVAVLAQIEMETKQ